MTNRSGDYVDGKLAKVEVQVSFSDRDPDRAAAIERRVEELFREVSRIAEDPRYADIVDGVQLRWSS